MRHHHDTPPTPLRPSSSRTPQAPTPSSFIPPPLQGSSQRAEGKKKEEAPKPCSMADGYGVHKLGDIKSYESMSPTYHQGDLPQLPAPIDDTRDSTTNNGMSNPWDPHQSIGREWAQVPIHSWPRGMRIHKEGRDPRVPTDADMNSYFTPCLADVQAIRYLAELSPARQHHNTSTKLAWKTWQHLFWDLFSIPGLYAHIIGSTRFPLGNRRRERFPFDTQNMDMIHVTITDCLRVQL